MLQVPATDGTLARGVWRRWCFSILYNSPFNLGNNSKDVMIRHSLQLYLPLWLEEYFSSSPQIYWPVLYRCKGNSICIVQLSFIAIFHSYNKPFGMPMPQTMGRRTNSKGIENLLANSCVCFTKCKLVDSQYEILLFTWTPFIAVLFWTTMPWNCRGPLAKSFKITFFWEYENVTENACYSQKHAGTCWIINHQQGKLSKI